jgi:hypothetical protein
MKTRFFTGGSVLKGHDNEADFLGFLQKLVFAEIGVGESTTLQLAESGSRLLNV